MSGYGGCTVISSSSGGSITYGDCETLRSSPGWLGSIVPYWGMLFASCFLASPWQPATEKMTSPAAKIIGRQGEWSILAIICFPPRFDQARTRPTGFLATGPAPQ